MFCPQCGKRNLDEARFCSNCGEPLPSRSADEEDHDSSSYKKLKNKTLLYIGILVSSVVIISVLLSINTAVNETSAEESNQGSKALPNNELVKLSALHRSMIGHWIEYRTRIHAYISKDAIVFKNEDDPRLESYIYRVYNENTFTRMLLLKVKQQRDDLENNWEALCYDFGQGKRQLTIGRGVFSYVDGQIIPGSK